jgi:hypothetical protein
MLQKQGGRFTSDKKSFSNFKNKNMQNIILFKEKVEPYLNGYEIKYKFFEKGDFGDLDQIEFNSKAKGGEIDLWSMGWLGIHLVDYTKEEELLNVFLEPHQQEEKEKALEKLQELLQQP